MGEIIFLVHRLPFPPDKGDKIRSYHLLRHLTARYKVHLGCFIDDVDDEKYLEEVESLCASAQVRRLNPLTARAKSLKGLITNQALSLPYYYDKVLAAWVENILQTKQIESIIAYSSPMGQYVIGSAFTGYRRIMDFVDVDSDKWRQYGEGTRWPMSWVYAREAKYLFVFERSIAREFDASVFVTQNEVDLFNSLVPETASKHYAVANGVATDYFDPGTNYESPFPAERFPIVFTGMMDYWANIDAVCWFAREIFPEIRSREPKAEFWIVGASPTRDVLALKSISGVNVTGRVPDVRPYLKHAEFALAPLRVARGIQNKVLEALAMGCPVLCTPQAASGLQECSTTPVTIVDSGSKMVEAAIRLLQSCHTQKIRDSARNYILKYYSWQRNLDRFAQIEMCSAVPLACPGSSYISCEE
jgi:sugar transferase (PEP-CTERM/EpsH1 system associated)